MSIPLTSKLSFLWSSVTGQDKMYSDVYSRTVGVIEHTRRESLSVDEKNTIIGQWDGKSKLPPMITYTPAGTTKLTKAEWAEAAPQGGTYAVTMHSFERATGKTSVTGVASGLNRTSAAQLLGELEASWKGEGLTRDAEQPFASKKALSP